MSRGIPSVKQWRVTFVDGTRLEIGAPTRRLALLNVRIGLRDWRDIATIGVLRRKPAGSTCYADYASMNHYYLRARYLKSRAN